MSLIYGTDIQLTRDPHTYNNTSRTFYEANSKVSIYHFFPGYTLRSTFTEFNCIFHVSLELMITLPQPPRCGYYRPVPPYLCF